MKNIASTPIMTLGIFCIAAATITVTHAANMVEMQVVSVITPAACTPMLSGGGVADYGTIPARSLKPGAVTPLPAALFGCGVMFLGAVCLRSAIRYFRKETFL